MTFPVAPGLSSNGPTMKKIILYGILLLPFVAILSNCRKEDVQTPPVDPRFPLPLLTKDTAGDDYISGKDPASFLGRFVVDMYYGTAVTAQEVDVVVMKNDDRANVKTLRRGVIRFPANIQVTGAQLTTLFDSTIQLGDKFEIGADVTTKDRQKFEAFPISGNPYGADTTALPGYRFSIVYVATCTFDNSSYDGVYTVVQDTFGDADWGDLKAGDGVFIGAGTEGNQISVYAYPYNAPLYYIYPMGCQIDPVTFDITIFPWQIIGMNTTPSWPTIYVESGTGTASPCGDAITLNMTLTAVYYSSPGVPSGGYSQTGVLELRK